MAAPQPHCDGCDFGFYFFFLQKFNRLFPKYKMKTPRFFFSKQNPKTQKTRNEFCYACSRMPRRSRKRPRADAQDQGSVCISSTDVSADVQQPRIAARAVARTEYGALYIDGTLNHVRVRIAANLRALQLLRTLGIPRRQLWQYCACGRQRCRHAYLV
jgi:hypothetical protein